MKNQYLKKHVWDYTRRLFSGANKVKFKYILVFNVFVFMSWGNLFNSNMLKRVSMINDQDA